MGLLDLNTEQQKAFNRLKKAYVDCKKLKVELVNTYGTLQAFDGDLIKDFGDDQMQPHGNPIYYTEIVNKYPYNSNIIRNVDPGRADDECMWMIGLTDKGLKIYENGN